MSDMTREECEDLIIKKLIEIKEIATKYDKNFEYLSLEVYPDSVWANNNYWENNHPKIDANICAI